MKISSRQFYLVLLILCSFKEIYAKPVKVEEILTYKNSWQLDLGVSYSEIGK